MNFIMNVMSLRAADKASSHQPALGTCKSTQKWESMVRRVEMISQEMPSIIPAYGGICNRAIPSLIKNSIGLISGTLIGLGAAIYHVGAAAINPQQAKKHLRSAADHALTVPVNIVGRTCAIAVNIVALGVLATETTAIAIGAAVAAAVVVAGAVASPLLYSIYLVVVSDDSV